MPLRYAVGGQVSSPSFFPEGSLITLAHKGDDPRRAFLTNDRHLNPVFHSLSPHPKRRCLSFTAQSFSLAMKSSQYDAFRHEKRKESAFHTVARTTKHLLGADMRPCKYRFLQRRPHVLHLGLFVIFHRWLLQHSTSISGPCGASIAPLRGRARSEAMLLPMAEECRSAPWIVKSVWCPSR